jgi:signal peptidase I
MRLSVTDVAPAPAPTLTAERLPVLQASTVMTWARWVLFAALVYLVLPTSLGGVTSYVMVSGSSMNPTYTHGDLLILREAPTYEVGDIITYRVPDGEPGAGLGVVHRIVGGDATAGYVTQGDNNGFLDPWRPHDQDVLGQVEIHLPGLGLFVAWLRQPIIAGGLLAAIAVGLYVAEGPDEDEEDAPPVTDEVGAGV